MRASSLGKSHLDFGATIWLVFLVFLCSDVYQVKAVLDFIKVLDAVEEQCLGNSKFGRETDLCPGVKKCPRLFSPRKACWYKTCANQISQATCPELFFYTNASVTAFCDSKGEWNFNLVNVSKCTRLPNDVAHARAQRIYDRLIGNEEEKTKLYQNRVYVIFSWISLSFMVPSLVILFYFMDSKNVRFNLHKNLIFSFLLRVVTFFLGHYGNFDKTFCNVLWVLNRFFAVSEVTWMLNEAVFLLKLLFRAFDANPYFWCFFAFGWGFPVILTFGVYVPVMLTILDEEQKKMCWTEYKDSHYMLILYGPVTLMLLINFGTLIYVIYVLLQKLRTSTTSELLRLKKGIKAALILMPLFGVIYLMILYIPSDAPVWFNYLIRILYPMQGTLACLVYVVFNGEVRQVLKSKWTRWNSKSEFMDRTREIAEFLNNSRVMDNGKQLAVEREAIKLKSNPLYAVNPTKARNHTCSDGRPENTSSSTTPISEAGDQAKPLVT